MMAIPRKKSRILRVDDVEYRWMVSVRRGVLHLTVELDHNPGQILQAFFEPHDRFRRASDGRWFFRRQGRTITPEDVAKIIRHGLANGWGPSSMGKKPIRIHTWDTEAVAPKDPGVGDEADNDVAIKDIASEHVDDLCYSLSLSPRWREILFAAPVGQRYPIPEADRVRTATLDRRIAAKAKEYGLRFAAFNDGPTEYGFVVFGIQSVDFPEIITYTTNNPSIIDW